VRLKSFYLVLIKKKCIHLRGLLIDMTKVKIEIHNKLFFLSGKFYAIVPFKKHGGLFHQRFPLIFQP